MNEKKIPRKQLKGFARMTPAARRRAQSKGGRASQKKGVVKHWDSTTAKIAGRKGGLKLAENKGLDYMRQMGREGGLMRALKEQVKKAFNDARLIKKIMTSAEED